MWGADDDAAAAVVVDVWLERTFVVDETSLLERWNEQRCYKQKIVEAY